MKAILILMSAALAAMAAPDVGFSHRNSDVKPHSRYSAQGFQPQSQHLSPVAQPQLHNSAPAPQYSDVPAQYNFQWDVNDQYSGNFYGHQEQRDGSNTRGRLPDTRLMTVDYYADDCGVHPFVTFEGETLYPNTPV